MRLYQTKSHRRYGFNRTLGLAGGLGCLPVGEKFKTLQGVKMSTTTKKVAIFVDWESVRKEIKDIIDLCDKANDKSMQAICQKENLDCFNVQDIMSIIKKPVDKSSEDIFKIFVYDVNPLSLDEELDKLKIDKELNRLENERAKINRDDLQNTNMSNMIIENQRQIDCIETFKYPRKAYNSKDEYECQEYKKREETIKEIRKSHHSLMFQNRCTIRLMRQEFLYIKKENVPNNKPLFVDKKFEFGMFLALDIARVAYRHLVDEIIVFSKNEDIIPALECAQMNDLHVSLICIKEWDSIKDLKEKWQISEKLRRHADSVREISLLEIIKDKKSKEGQ